ncbi:MAG: hypothetical protein O3A46_08100 [Candidatus Poribacteria bacterium]|nr:hypothetical protein [Candidatus Poribacteria bacterium]
MTHPTFATDHLRLAMDDAGNITELEHRVTSRNVVARPSPLLQIVTAGGAHSPVKADCDDTDGTFTLEYGDGTAIRLRASARATHVSFEVIEVVGETPEAVMWGPISITVRGSIGEIVGVVRDDALAVGIQALSIQTVGGHPGQGVGHHEHAAAETTDGAALQAYARDADGGVIGSKIALFACPREDALQIIGAIELAEGLPHPMLDGEWTKTSRTARESYLIAGFGEASLDKLLDYTEKAGFRYLYQGHPFENWGHFDLIPSLFPDGDESLKRCSERATKRDIRLGLHTLTNFMTTNDPHVTPIPDPRLMTSGASALTADIDAAATDIPVAAAQPFEEKGDLSAARIGSEIVQYRSVSDGDSPTLVGCKRGAFGTSASNHAAGENVGKLIDHPYRIFFPNLELQDEMIDRLVELYNVADIRQISFDGLEGCERTGHGIYAHHRFVQRFYEGCDGEILNDASRLLHYNWHIHTRMNWGEPWGAAMREGMTEYRFKNQAYFERNLFPRMLGWFQLRLAGGGVEATSLGDIEWMLAKAAGYDAGFAVATGLDALTRNGQTDAILNAVREWETARLDGAFTATQRERLRVDKAEFHLERNGDGGWDLFPVTITTPYRYQWVERQPGEPTGNEWSVENPYGERPMQVTLRVVPKSGPGDAMVANPTFEIGFDTLTVECELQPDQYLVIDADGARICDANWNVLKSVAPTDPVPTLVHGANAIRFSCEGQTTSPVEATFKMIGESESVERPG